MHNARRDSLSLTSIHAAVVKFLTYQFHRANLRLGQRLDVAGLGDRDIAVTENRLNFFVWPPST